ncbi:VCBS repeat-containing protein [Fulvivirga sp. 29W222]|uniref:VCBS repeat-containing protein n=1 Tax=Fulvivirga marina TaxID=2494733 RepID=A0A937FUS1_9BACT|nr:FG-GAP-like repeat-containing protein [Fulvivirga marina]MBL6444788.1 VCBS repeat-containing protein [Fulvivirga marina]
MNKYIVVFFLAFCTALVANAQISISNIDPVSAYINEEVVITGSGFGANAANIVVWFGSVKATVNSVTDNLIRVMVPAGAYADNITVIHLGSRLAAQSSEKFFPVYSGTSFDGTKIATPVVFADPSGKQLYDPCTCDLDGDGRAEIISTKSSGANDAIQIQILFNQSTLESFSFSTTAISVGFPTLNIRCGDLNGDGKPDLYMSQSGVTRFHVLVVPNISNPGSLSFGAIQSLDLPTDVSTRRVAHKDLNGDDKPEIIVTNSGAGNVYVFENTSSGSISFNNTPVTINVAGASSTTGLDVQDIDGDGKADIIVCQFVGDDVFVLRNIGVGAISFASPYVLQLDGNSLINLTTGDFNEDGRLDIAAIANLTGRVVIFPNNSSSGSFNFGALQSFAINANPWGITTGDVDGDGRLDIITTSLTDNSMAILNNQYSGGNISFTRKLLNVGSKSRNVSVQDLDGDAKPDFVVTAQNGGVYDLRMIRNKNCYQPQVLNDQPLAICPTQTFTLVSPAAPAVTFNWTLNETPIGGNSNTLDITTYGLYEVQAVSESGDCVTSASINVANGSGTVPGDPVVADPLPACIGSDVTLSVSAVSGATYSWTGPNNFTSNVREPLISNVTRNDAGIYTVVVQVGDCRSSESSTTLEIVELEDFSAGASGATNVCQGSTVALSTQNRGGYTYQWQRNGVDIPSATAFSYLATQSGLYRVVVDDSGSSCKVTTNEVAVNVYTAPVVDFTTTSAICSGQTSVLTNTSTVDPSATVNYSWNFGDGQTSTVLNPTHTYTAANNYTVQLAVSYAGVTGCNGSKSKGVSVKAPIVPLIESAETSICPGGELELSVTGMFGAIEWTTMETTNAITISQPGTYGVNVQDANNCNAYGEIVIGSKPLPDVQATANSTSISDGDQVQLEATGADSYFWSPDLYLNDPAIPNPIALPEETITYTVTGTSLDGCSATAEITIVVNESVEIDITPLKAFSPNSTINPTWEIQNVEAYPDCTLSIFDEKGSVIFREKGYSNGWNATYEGKPLPEGVYYYVFGCEGLEPKTGTVLVVR